VSRHVFYDEWRSVQVLRNLGYLDEEARDICRALEGLERTKPIRRLIREYLPNGQDGYVVEDLDLLIRVFGQRFSTDGRGRLRLIELKCSHGIEEPARLRGGQAFTLGLLNDMLRSSAMAERYDGLYVVTHSEPDVVSGRIWIDRREVTLEEFIEWLRFGDCDAP
jgi:hypothetical protein